jgi:hypothetical protein
MLRSWLSWLGGAAIVVALILIALAARDLALAEDARRVEYDHGDLRRGAAMHRHTADAASLGGGQPTLFYSEPLGSDPA